jgi:hypothetical protein
MANASDAVLAANVMETGFSKRAILHRNTRIAFNPFQMFRDLMDLLVNVKIFVVRFAESKLL